MNQIWCFGKNLNQTVPTVNALTSLTITVLMQTHSGGVRAALGIVSLSPSQYLSGNNSMLRSGLSPSLASEIQGCIFSCKSRHILLCLDNEVKNVMR